MQKKKISFFFFHFFHFLSVFFTFFCFFWGVLDHVLRPPCRRYGGDSFTKKVGNAKNQFTYFSVFRYSKPFGPHATSKVCIYFRQKPIYGHPVGDRAECLLQKKKDNQKILDTYFSVFRYLKPFGTHATSNVYL